MPSLRSRFIGFLLEHRHWFRLQWQREVIDRNTSIPGLRARVEAMAGRLGKLPAGILVEPLPDAGLPGEWLYPAGHARDRAILYFHGGGYVMGSSRSHRGAVAKFVQGSGLPALVFDYRLAPEHPFPAALDDALAAYRLLLARGIAPERIVFAGDSAGGGLCLATLLALRAAQQPLPAAAAVLSPWTDLCCSGDSYRHPDPLAPAGSWQVFGAYYAGTHDPADPLVSPLYGDLAGLPPLLIHVGGAEAMLDDSTQFAAKARAAGVAVRLEIAPGLFHCYPALAPLFPEATAAMADICAFLRHAAEGSRQD